MRASCCSKTTIPLWTAAFLTVLALALTLWKDSVSNATQPGSVPNTDRYVGNPMQVATILPVILDLSDLIGFGRGVSGHRRKFSDPQLGYRLRLNLLG
jgi:hypothetical protein